MTSKYLAMITMTAAALAMAAAWISSMEEKTTMIEWKMMEMTATKMSATLMMDAKSTAFASCVLLITSAIIIYSNYYMKENKKKILFLKLIMIFILSMMMLIFSPNMISMIVGWEGLGMSSFILIIFYQNKKALNSGFYTMIMNRVGDIMMMMSMVKMMSHSSWVYSSSAFSDDPAMIVMMMTASMAKSAQIPFSSWLTEAMAAPTPISALVHSSTLVTAGVFMFIRFEMIIKHSKILMKIMLVSMTTLMMASMNSITEWDLKKIIALSTLSQMSIMFITISMNLFNLAMFHLLVHASFKALIFLSASTMISTANTQDIRKMKKTSSFMFMTKLSFNTAILSLTGFPFMSSFYSKEMIMEMNMMKKSNLLMTLMFYLCMMSTLFYSLKMIKFTSSMTPNQLMAPTQESPDQKLSKMALLVPAILYGNKMNWIMNLNFKIPHLTKTEKMLPLAMMVMTTLTTMEMFNFNHKTSMINSTTKQMITYMWFMKNLSLQAKKNSLTEFFLKFKSSEKETFSMMIWTSKNTIKKMTKTNFLMVQKAPQKLNMMILIAATTVM